MQALRHTRILARLVLAWFALALGVAVASPLVQPKSIELICAGGAIKLMVQGEEGGAVPASHSLDCPLCATVAAPPPCAVPAPRVLPLEHAAQAIPAARAAARVSAPLPARGPPRSLG